MKLRGEKFIIAMTYFNKGYGLTSLVKYGVAVFAIKITDYRLAFISGLAYAILCYIVGRLWYKYKLIDTEIEINNRVNPFVREMRKKVRRKKS